jgi:peptidoglycan-associated lipoprotein
MMRGRKHLLGAVLVAAFALASGLMAGCDKDTPAPAQNSMAPGTDTTAPTATISATPGQIAPGDLVTIEWTTTAADRINISGIGSVPASGTRTVSPTSTTTFRLVAKGQGGRAEAATVVTVIKGATKSTGNTPPVVEAPPKLMTPEQEFTANVQDIFFDYDSYDVRTETQPALSKAASYLVSHPNLNVVVSGYCDERGSNEYNVALGEDRADSVKDALVNAGIAASRIRVVSYGKEQPFCSDNTEECWQQNRRATIKLDNGEQQ